MLQIRWFIRWAIIAVSLALATLGLGGCSTLRLAYTQGSTLAYWWLDGYLDFTDAQAPVLREALDQWFDWHRRNELPGYVALLQRAAVEVGQDATPEQVCRWYDELQDRLDVAVRHALPSSAAIATNFDAGQLTHLARKQAKNNAEFRSEYLQSDPAARSKASVARAVERAEQLYGRLDDAQRERIVHGVSASPFEPERWLAEREWRQRDLVQTLTRLRSTPMGRDAATAVLASHWQHVLVSPDPAYERYQARLRSYNCAWIAQVHNSTTPAQREVAQRKLRGWASDLRSLRADGS